MLHATCFIIQLVKEQFGDEYDLEDKRKVQFADSRCDAAIEMTFRREIPGGWLVTRASAEKVSLY